MQTEYIYDVSLFIHVVARGPIILLLWGGLGILTIISNYELYLFKKTQCIVISSCLRYL